MTDKAKLMQRLFDLLNGKFARPHTHQDRYFGTPKHAKVLGVPDTAETKKTGVMRPITRLISPGSDKPTPEQRAAARRLTWKREHSL